MREKPTDQELHALLFSALTIPLWPHTGQALRLSKNSTYAGANRGEIPVIEIGGVKRVSTAALRRMLGIDAIEAKPGKVAA